MVMTCRGAIAFMPKPDGGSHLTAFSRGPRAPRPAALATRFGLFFAAPAPTPQRDQKNSAAQGMCLKTRQSRVFSFMRGAREFDMSNGVSNAVSNDKYMKVMMN